MHEQDRFVMRRSTLESDAAEVASLLARATAARARERILHGGQWGVGDLRGGGASG